MHREFTHKTEPITSKVTKLIPVCCKNFSRNHDELDDIMARLQDLLEKKGHLGLSVKEETRSKDVNRRLQTSMVDASSIVGRQAEKEALVQKLLRDEESDKNFSIVPIVGMGGVGKTTLVRLLYNEQQVKDHFELKAWVCVSDEFDSFAIRLSYQDLSARVKQLFAYCSLFPKNYVFDKETLVQLWMAEGFLQQSTSSDSEKECFGHECFDELLSRSFFQHAPNNESLFVMHDLMNDLATSVAGEFLLRVENNTREEALEKYRHMSFICERYAAYKKFEPYKRANSLRTFMALPFGVVEERYFFLSDKILVDLLPELPLLRVLCLSDSQISEVPESIGTLKHLRYLNLSKTIITQLPENASNVYNLETLILFGCHSLAKLPNNFSKLKNLRHLDIRKTPKLDRLPLGIGELKSLQTLSKFIINGEGGFEITKLKDLKNLCGKISFVGLDKVQKATYARDANFSQKRLSELEVVWSDVSINKILEKEVLNELKPSNDCLEKLNIVLYGGLEFPQWVGDPSFQRLKHVSIRGCKNCTSLPPLGQLRSLEELFIEGLVGVKVVALELLGTACAFQSLKVLSFINMEGQEKWSANRGEMVPSSPTSPISAYSDHEVNMKGKLVNEVS